VTTHLDIAPTLLGLTNADPQMKAAIAKNLPGKDLAPLLVAPEAASHDTVRDGALYCYNMLAYIDGQFLENAGAVLKQPDGKAKLKEAAQAGTMRPDLSKRGAIRAVYDGHYRFARYFSPKQHNRPVSVEALLKLNDVELYDVERDPLELDNLAKDPAKHREVLEVMNAKLNALIDREVGEDVGQMLPGGVDGGWVATDAVYDL
jgi:arylsulfatase A-like enzyme